MGDQSNLGFVAEVEKNSLIDDKLKEARENGYCIIIFTTEEMQGACPYKLADHLIEKAWDIIDDLKPIKKSPSQR